MSRKPRPPAKASPSATPTAAESDDIFDEMIREIDARLDEIEVQTSRLLARHG